ncbi:MAG: TetR/AcrR family transcriptional regulator [Clostridiales bacterium]|nr:TetR/AcrR family transcriptional regulator [Clostridiales bacterium]
MGRKAKITKEMVLEAAYELLDESGIGAVGIKPIAAKLGCSTQPVSWLFGSMTELKKELYMYSANKVFGGLPEAMQGKDAVDAFFVSGVWYISIACDHPNVFRFINVDDPVTTIGENIFGERSIFTEQMNGMAVDMLAEQFKISKEKVGEAVQNTVIYTHGLSVMMMWDSYRLSKEAACRMIFDMGVKLMKDIGIEIKEKKWEDLAAFL